MIAGRGKGAEKQEEAVLDPAFCETAAIRRAFLAYFAKHDHRIMPSASLIPEDDSLLFTNAGMNPFKAFFAGTATPPHPALASAQRCMRAGGKHNDLMQVGYTARHHTCFEMLGNFSFGAYSKETAIRHAWRFLTQVLRLPASRLWVTVYQEDKETEEIWLRLGYVPSERICRCSADDNYWSMGETGPCGPCTEIFYDHGPDVQGGPPSSETQDGDRYTEIWNIVFMQFNRDASGQEHALPALCVDTGMGLERIAAVMQGKTSNYDTDVFRCLRAKAAVLCGVKDTGQAGLKVIADHVRAAAFLIADGVCPAPTGRGYVLRRIIRRAARHGYQLEQKSAFLFKLVPTVIAQMGEAYPALLACEAAIATCIHEEEALFSHALSEGLKQFDLFLSRELGNATVLPGEYAFKLYDTYGFPLDLTLDLASEKGLEVDQSGFERAMAQQRQQSQQHSLFSDAGMDVALAVGESQFVREKTQVKQAKLLHIMQLEKAGQRQETAKPVALLRAGMSGIVTLDATPFYAQGGGQVGDQGEIRGRQGNTPARFEVKDTQKKGEAYWHYGTLLSGTLSVGESVEARIDQPRRQAIACHHTATHLLHAVLRAELGHAVVQKGSLVEATRLRFDFTYTHALSETQLAHCAARINRWIWDNLPVQAQVMSQAAAKVQGALALFGEKYGEQVRVLTIGQAQPISIELCGGTHVQRTGDLGIFVFTAQSAVAAGIRRVEAKVEAAAWAYLEDQKKALQAISDLLKTDKTHVHTKLTQLLTAHAQCTKQLERLATARAQQWYAKLCDVVETVDGVTWGVLTVSDGEVAALRHVIDSGKQQWDNAVIVLLLAHKTPALCLVGVSVALSSRLPAHAVLGHINAQYGGRGGGRPDFAQGVVPDWSAAKDKQLVAALQAWVTSQVAM